MTTGRPPPGCAAARRLGDTPLLVRAVAALARSGVVDRVVVTVPPALASSVQQWLAGIADGPDVEVLAVHDNGPGVRLLAALRAHPPAAGGIVVVHDPLHPLAPPSLVLSVVRVLVEQTPGCAGVVPIRPVTDTLEAVDEDDVITATADRESFRMVYSPQAYRGAPLLRALEAAAPAALRERGADRLPGSSRMRAGGCSPFRTRRGVPDRDRRRPDPGRGDVARGDERSGSEARR